jgi:hypothetical protein
MVNQNKNTNQPSNEKKKDIATNRMSLIYTDQPSNGISIFYRPYVQR